jgi:hypothetical protein
MQVWQLTLAPLLPALPAVALVVEAFRARTARGARAIIVLGVLTIVTGVAIFVACVVQTFLAVADAQAEDKAALMARGFARGQSAVTLAIVVGVGLCALGAIARALYRAPPAVPVPPAAR